jgi:hypothetical protein
MPNAPRTNASACRRAAELLAIQAKAHTGRVRTDYEALAAQLEQAAKDCERLEFLAAHPDALMVTRDAGGWRFSTRVGDAWPRDWRDDTPSLRDALDARMAEVAAPPHAEAARHA